MDFKEFDRKVAEAKKMLKRFEEDYEGMLEEVDRFQEEQKELEKQKKIKELEARIARNKQKIRELLERRRRRPPPDMWTKVIYMSITAIAIAIPVLIELNKFFF